MGEIFELPLGSAATIDIGDATIEHDPVVLYAERYLQKPWRFPDRYVESSTLSLAMVVKNEENNLTRCLESVKGAVDEIVVIDLGSTDATVEIAKNYGAKVISLEWCSDFAEAKTISLEHATGDWVMFLDANEELMREDIASLRDLLDDNEYESYYVNEFNFLGENAGEGVAVSLSLRLFRNRPEHKLGELSYEQIQERLQSQNSVAITDIRINHYGFLSNESDDKNKRSRNLDLLLEEAEKDPDNPFLMCSLGLEYLKRKDYEKALETYKKAFANLSGHNLAYASKLVRNIAMCLKELGRHHEALMVLDDAKEAYPDYTDLFYLEGLVHFEDKDLPSAIRCFDACLAMGPAGKSYTGQPGVGEHLAAHMLARAHKAVGNRQEAIDAYTKALTFNPRYRFSLLEMGLMLARREELYELQQLLEPLADMSSEEMLLSLALVFSYGGHYQTSLTYLDRLAEIGAFSAHAAVVRGECLLNLRRYSEAIEALDAIPESSEHFLVACIDRAICCFLMGDYGRALSSVEPICSCDAENLLCKVYRSVISLPGEEPILLSIDDSQKAEALELYGDLMQKFIELQEFEACEKSVRFLDYFNLSSGEVGLFLGKVYYDAGLSDAAVENLIHAYEAGCADGEAFFILGRASLEGELYEDAKTFFFEALNRGIEDYALYISLARTLIKLGEINKAVEVLDMGAERYPESQLIAEISQGISALL